MTTTRTERIANAYNYPAGCSDAAILICLFAYDAGLAQDKRKGLYTTIMNGAQLEQDGYRVSEPFYCTPTLYGAMDPAESHLPAMPADLVSGYQYIVTRPDVKVAANGIESHTVDVSCQRNEETGKWGLRWSCDRGCKQYGVMMEVLGQGFCKHIEACALRFEDSEAYRQFCFLKFREELTGRVQVIRLPEPTKRVKADATIASQESVCKECNGKGEVPNGVCYVAGSTYKQLWKPCPTCQPWERDPPHFNHHDINDFKPVSASTRAADWE